MPRKKEFASVIVKYRDGMIRYGPLETIMMIAQSRGVSGRPDLAQHRVRLKDVDRFCELIGQDNPAFEKIIDVEK